jgi:hypothetical protein
MFTKLFLDGTAEAKEAQIQKLREGKSIMDTVREETRQVRGRLGKEDREKLEEYLYSVREMEQRLSAAEAWVNKPKPKVDVSIPEDIKESKDLIGQMQLLFELIPLALQTDSTRLITVMVQGRNDPLGSDGRKILGQQAESLIAAVTQFANAKDANGQNILRAEPVSTALIAPSISLESGISYNEVMMGPVGTGKDVLAIMRSVKDKLVAGNSHSDEDMVNFQAALTQVTRAQVKTGLLQNQLDAATEAAEVQKTNVELQRSNLLDTDLATATASLVKSNALLQAAQSVMTKLDVNTLFQKL